MKLICYPASSELPNIRPGPSDRGWMDTTHERHAYRCLPLSIANTCGWEILNPRPFTAVWNGTAGLDAVRVRCKEGEAPALSHFGSGILTFHVTGLFETPPGIMLWAGGSPNNTKDAIQPLTGLIETDWSPYTFTMNWKFTRAGQRIRFEKDEPFCFIMPIDPGLVESVQPEFRRLDTNPDLEKNYQQWSKSRNSFNADLKQPDSEAVKKKWQKNYHRGIKPDGTKPDAKHRTKLRVKSFTDKRK